VAVIELDSTRLREALAQLERPDPTAPGPSKEQPPKDPAATLRRGLRPIPAVRQPRAYRTIEDAQDMIRQHVIVYLNDPMPDRMLLIAAPAGIGKTTLAVEVAERRVLGSSDGRIMYIGPRKEFFDDIRVVSARLGLIAPAQFDATWYPWQGHHSGDQDNQLQHPASCRWAPQIKRWMQRGYTGMSFCEQHSVCGWNYINNDCAYHAQRARPERIIFAQYEHASLGHPLLEQCRVLIGDELPIRAFLYTTDDQPGWIIPPHAIAPDGVVNEPLEYLLRTLQRLTTSAPRESTTWHGAALLEALGGAEYVAAVCETATMDARATAVAPHVRQPADVDDVPYFHLRPTVQLLAREAAAAVRGEPQIERIQVDRQGLHLLLRRTPANLPPHVIWLDATANARMYETLFQRPVEVVQPEVALRGKVYQVWASLNNKGQFLSGVAESEQAKQAQAKTDHLRKQITHITERGYATIGYIGHKGIIDRLVPDGTAPDLIAHFGGSRGTNRLEHCDCLIVVGAPQPRIPAMLDAAAMLYDQRNTAFDPTWSIRDLAFEGLPYAYSMGGFWNDPDLQVLLEQYRDAEILQSIHRARPLRNDVDVWLLTNVPIAGLPVQLVSLHTLYGAVDRNGEPLKVKDPSRWPAVLRWADQVTAGDSAHQITVADVRSQFQISAPTARGWMAALVATGHWRFVSLEGLRSGAPGKSICKAFRHEIN
jgi:hypothetical protein